MFTDKNKMWFWFGVCPIFFNTNNDVFFPTEFQFHHTPTGVNFLLCMICNVTLIPSSYLILHVLYLDLNIVRARSYRRWLEITDGMKKTKSTGLDGRSFVLGALFPNWQPVLVVKRVLYKIKIKPYLLPFNKMYGEISSQKGVNNEVNNCWSLTVVTNVFEALKRF
jgi:hypothetical protein